MANLTWRQEQGRDTCTIVCQCVQKMTESVFIVSKSSQTTIDTLLCSAHGEIIRDLCLARDNHYQSPHLLSYTEIIMLFLHLCAA